MSIRARHRIRKAVERNRREMRPWPGRVGDGNGTIEVPGHPNLWYVREEGSELPIPVYKGSAPRQEGYPIWVGKDVYNKRWLRILGIDAERAANGGFTISEVGPHGSSHLISGSDPAWIDARQVINVLAYASTGMIVHVNAGWVIIDGQPVKVASANLDLTSSIPATGAAYSIIRASDTGALSVVDGTPVASLIDLTPSDAPAFANGYAAIAIAKLYDGMTELSRSTTAPDVIPLYLAQVSGAEGGVVTALDDLSDVTITSAAEGDLLVNRSAVWVNEAAVDISSDDADISAVNFEEQGSDPAAPTTGHWLIYAKSGGIYVEDDASAVTGPIGATTFNDAEGNPADTDETTAADGTSAYAARRDHRHKLGTVNLNDLDDVNAPSPTANDVLIWDDDPGEWIAGPIPNSSSETELKIPIDGFGKGSAKPSEEVLGDWAGYAFTINDLGYFSFEVPEDWDEVSDIDIALHWYINEAYATNSGEVRFAVIRTIVDEDGTDAVDAGSSAINGADMNIPATAKALTEYIVTIPAAGLAKHKIVGFQVKRIALADGSNPTAEPVVVGMEAEYGRAVLVGEGGASDASDVTYTPAVATDWDGDADPGNVDGALDQLAERVDDLEAGGGSGDSTYTDAYGSRPAAGNDGDLFFPNNGFVVERDTGAAWVPWGPLYPMTAPVAGDFAWINQENATVSTTNGGIHLVYPGTGSTGSSKRIRLQKKAAPTAPYTITAAFLPRFDYVTSSYSSCGLVWRQSSDGKVITFNIVLESFTKATIWIAKWSDANTFSASYILQQFGMIPTQPCWMQLVDDNTNRICKLSFDGINFSPVHTVGRTDFMTANEVGFNVNTNTADNVLAGMTLLSWKAS